MSEINKNAQPKAASKIVAVVSSTIALITSGTLVALFATGAIGNKAEYILSLPADRFYQDSYATTPTLDVGFGSEAGTGSIYGFEDKTDVETLGALLKKTFKIDGEFEPETPSPYVNNGEPTNYRLETKDELLDIGVDSTMNFQYTNKKPYDRKCLEEEVLDELNTICKKYEEYTGPILSDEEAKSKTAALFTELGLPTTIADVRVVRTTEDEPGTQVDLKIDGMSSGLYWNIFWGDGGKIESLTGWNVNFVKLSDVEVVSPDAAAQRIMDYTWYAFPQNFQEPLPTELRPTSFVRGQTVVYDAEDRLVSVPVYSFSYEGGIDALDILAVKKLHLIPVEVPQP